MWLIDLVSKHDSNNDGFLTHDEIEAMFDELGLSYNKHTRERFIKKLLDPAGRQRISADVLKFYFGDDQKKNAGNELDYEPSRENG